MNALDWVAIAVGLVLGFYVRRATRDISRTHREVEAMLRMIEENHAAILAMQASRESRERIAGLR